jgi:hypothetical protein
MPTLPSSSSSSLLGDRVTKTKSSSISSSSSSSSSLLFCFPSQRNHHIISLTASLKLFTKKTGAGSSSSLKLTEETLTMTDIIDALRESLQPIQQIMSLKQILLDIRLQAILLTPWIAHFDQLLNNIRRILNDRVSMLWRKSSSRSSSSTSPSALFENACSLYDDVNEVTNIIHKILVIFAPKQVFKRMPSYGNSLQTIPSGAFSRVCIHLSLISRLLGQPLVPSVAANLASNSPTTSSTIIPPANPPPASAIPPPSTVSSPTNQAHSSTGSGTSSGTAIFDCELCMHCKQLISRCRSHLLHTFPSLLKRIEKYISTILSSSLETICNQFLIKNCFLFSKRSLSAHQLDSPTSIHMFGYTLRDHLLRPAMLSIKTFCKSRHTIESIMTLCVNTSVSYLLDEIKRKRLRFNEYGVYILYTLLNTLLQWIISSKTDLSIPLSSPLILDTSPWLRANSILQVLLLATSGGLVGVHGVMDPTLMGDPQGHSSRYQALSQGQGVQSPTSPTNSMSAGNSSTQFVKKKLGRHLTIFEYERWAELGVPPQVCCISIEHLPLFFRARRSHGAVSLSTTLDIRDI